MLWNFDTNHLLSPGKSKLKIMSLLVFVFFILGYFYFFLYGFKCANKPEKKITGGFRTAYNPSPPKKNLE